MHHLSHVLFLLIPGGTACLLEAVYSGVRLTVTITPKCPAYDMFALQLREEVEEAIEGLRAEPVRVPSERASGWEEFQEQQIEKWTRVFEDTRILRRPSGAYSVSKRKAHRIARDELRGFRRLRSLDGHLFRLLGSQAIIPRLSVSIREDYRWTARTWLHQLVRHDAYQPLLVDRDPSETSGFPQERD